MGANVCTPACTFSGIDMALTITVVVGQWSVGAHPRSELAEQLLQRLREARFGIQIEIINDGAAVPWSVRQTVMH
ncbi:MAG: hypothetical protein ACI8RZ_000640 [Myxococcota bacterium]|jgi:hypothetical protein